MLNSPLSVLSDELLAYIVESVADYGHEALCALSVADRAFTQFCQAHIFRTFKLAVGSKRRISRNLDKIGKILDNTPSYANRVRIVKIALPNDHVWLFNNHTLLNIFRLLAKSPMSPYELHFGGYSGLIIEDPMFVVRRLMQSFFSQTLTVLHLTEWMNVPLPVFLALPRLKELYLAHVGVAVDSQHIYADERCSGREVPALEMLKYRDSHSLVNQMIELPPAINTPEVLWSKLCVLRLCPKEMEDMACLQPILNAACNTLEELYLDVLKVERLEERGEPSPAIAGLVNLSNLPRLRVFAVGATINCDALDSAVLRDINTVINTIPLPNEITNLSFDLIIFGRHPFGRCLEEDWVGLCNEAIRISASKALELEIMMVVHTEDLLQDEHPGAEQLYFDIMERRTSLADHPNICIHFWNPTYWSRQLAPVPLGQVRGRCKR